MVPVGKTLKLCSCNRTMPLDLKALGKTLGLETPIAVHHSLCRGEIGAFQQALSDPELIVGCTQEAPLFAELRDGAQSTSEVKFVNIREQAGWGSEAKQATPKIAALIAAAALPDPDPVTSVEYRSGGQLLIIGPSAVALDWAERLAGQLEPAVLMTRDEGGELPIERRYAVWSGTPQSVQGYLGAFEVSWEQDNPIDLELCTRCNACVSACPESAIDFTYQVDLDKCKSHRKCVAACGAIGAIDFDRAERTRRETFDLVLDLGASPMVTVTDLPQGYQAPGADPLAQSQAVAKLVQLVGEFEKPRFFEYREKICAHSRSSQTGCNRCIDVCSTGAIRDDGDLVTIEPHLCAGCGGCATVCPSGALRHVYPGMPYLGRRLKTMLDTYRGAGGSAACIVLHGLERGRTLVQGVGRRALRGGRGLPARAIPLELFHIASAGIDLCLGALCYGAVQVVVVVDDEDPEAYVQALEAQMAIAQAIVGGLGYAGRHFAVLRANDAAALEAQLWALDAAQAPAVAATFHLSDAKRTTLDFEIDHLAKHAPKPQERIALPAGAPFGALAINRETCTLCKACIGACPEGALLDAPETPSLRFIERNCVQCGLCVNTCPEDAIALVPQLGLTAEVKQPVTLNEAEPFRCVGCGAPFGTRRMVEAMLGKLGSHGMFAGGGLRRLQLCADCRVADMVNNPSEQSVLDYTRPK